VGLKEIGFEDTEYIQMARFCEGGVELPGYTLIGNFLISSANICSIQLVSNGYRILRNPKM